MALDYTKENSSLILSSLENNGLINDLPTEEALFLIQQNGEEYLSQFLTRYSIKDSYGQLIFTPETRFSRIRKDLLCDVEIANLIISTSSLLRVKLSQLILRIRRGDEALFSSYFPEVSLEDIAHDYLYNFPSSLKRRLSSYFDRSVSSFYSSLSLISYAYERAREKRKNLDYIFPDNLKDSYLPINNMIASITFEIESLLEYFPPYTDSMRWELAAMIVKYDINKERIGLN